MCCAFGNTALMYIMIARLLGQRDQNGVQQTCIMAKGPMHASLLFISTLIAAEPFSLAISKRGTLSTLESGRLHLLSVWQNAPLYHAHTFRCQVSKH